MDVYVTFLKTVFQTVVTLFSAAATLFTTAPPPPPGHSHLQGVGLRRASLVWQADAPGGFAARLASADPAERTRAACELQRARGAAVDLMPSLVEMLRDATPVDATICGDRWGRWKDGQVPLTSPGERAAAALVSIGSAAFESLSQAMRAPDWVARKNAAWALGALDDGRGVQPLIRSLADTEAPVRRNAAWGLGALDASDAVEALAKAVGGDSDAEVRSQAAWALGAIGDRQAVAALVSALTDAEPKVRRQAAWALGAIGDRQAVDGLVKALRDDTHAETRAQSAWALGAIGDNRASDALAAALKDAEVKVRRQAAWALGAVGR